jgi:hypothetical protein
LHTVVDTFAFEKGAEEIGLTEEEKHQIRTLIASDPTAGVLIPGTGGARKLRFPLKSKGKSGGCRVVTYYSGEDIPVFLLDVFAKSVKINLTKAERNELKQVLSGLADDYRASLREKMKKIGRAS